MYLFMVYFFRLRASTGIGPSNIIIGPPSYLRTIRDGKLNFKSEIGIVKKLSVV